MEDRIKLYTWLLFMFLTLSSLFGLFGATISSNTLGLALMMLLLALFADLREFDFWGLKGKKIEYDLEELKGERALAKKRGRKKTATAKDIEFTSAQLPVMDDRKGSFLAYAFEIERLLRVFATTSLAKDISPATNAQRMIEELFSSGYLTDSGKRQIEAVVWLRNLLVHGRDNEITGKTLEDGLELAMDLHSELNDKLYG